jgi:NAD(P)-dependent dehydrogenase (short-subunit alcohol dehydrogenase family)
MRVDTYDSLSGQVALVTGATRGRVVNLSSGLGTLGAGMDGGSPPYRVSKAGLNGLIVITASLYRW